MDWAKVVIFWVAFQSITDLLPHRAAAEDLLSPFLAPVFNEMCNHTVECGKGTCQESSESILGFVCKCNPGWSQLHIGDHLSFLPCIIPNCSINYSCYNDSTAPAAPPSPHPTKLSILDSCKYSYCGRGTCVNTSTFGYRCECKEGFSNLFNQTSFPCYRDCSLGADCQNLGITLSNSSASSPPSLSDSGSSSGGDYFIPSSLLWMIMLAIPLVR